MNQSVIKALQLLDLFTEEDSELTLHELAQRANMPKSTAYRLLTTLESRGVLDKIKETKHDARYRLGIKLLELGELVASRLELRHIALPFMQSLAEEINEVIHLVIVNQDKAIYIEKVDSNRALRLNTRIGKSSPLYIGSGPKLLLAFLPNETQDRILSGELEPLNCGRLVDVEKLRQELEIIRKKGYAYSIGEQDADTTGISYPIYDHLGKVIASLAVSGLSSYYEGENLIKIKQKSSETAQAISRQLGYQS
ncbi:MAG TPA: IclR family transcriptional regulator [Virgibacillus sp.]|nr:IclR family transcriptional regulator [Virgibacillus sp.]